MPMKSDKKVIASIVRHKDIEKVIKYKENIKSVFILISDFINIKDIVQLFHDNDLEVYIHVEMIKGLKLDDFGFKYLKNVVKPDGIITTKSSHVNLAKKNNIYVIQRFFLADYNMFDNIISTTKKSKPDAIEVMPVLTSYLFKDIYDATKIPIISGGLVDRIEQVEDACNHGALGVSTSKVNLWKN